jgi:hypothetical protein
MKIKERETMLNSLLEQASQLGIALSNEDKFQISLNGNAENIKIILTEIENKQDKNDKIKTFKTLTNSYLKLKFPDAASEESSIWKKEEIINLQKAVKKFPAGTKNRWEKIEEIVKTKSANSIIAMTHYLTTNPSIKIDKDIVNNIFNHIGSQCNIKQT